MSHLNSGLLLPYNSLTDKHLTGYFSNTRIRKHLLRAGLITRSGRIVPDKEYRHRLLQRAHQKHVRECLAQAIFHKVLEMERLHRTEIKKKLEEFTRRERVHKIKVQHSKRCEEDVARVLSPHPPTGARGRRKNDSGPEGERSESSLSPSSSRPNTAPGKMQRPVRLKPIHSSSTTASVRRNSPYRLHESSHTSSQPLNRTMNKESCRASGPKETSFDISPCYLPVINNFVTPIPPVTRRKDRSSEISPNIRGRRLRNATAFSGAEDLPWLRSSIHQSQVCMNMVYFGKMVHLSHDLLDLRDEVKVFQQHCGGENLCVYKGMLREGETFQFLSRRHRGFPFSLTFFLNGLQVERLSACCEFKYRKGSRLGGKHGNFGFLGVEGAAPCYKCIIALGLDKMPTPPPKRLKEGKGPEELITSPKDSAEVEADGGNAAFSSESSQAKNTESQDQTFLEEDKTREDYEEDFEADDEAAAEEAKEDLSPSPSAQTETQGKENEAPETEDEKDEDIKSDSDSSFSDSDQEESDVEAKNDIREEENREPIEEHEEKGVTPEEEEEEQNPEETAEEEAIAVNSAADSTEVEITDPRGPSGNEMKLSEETPQEEKMAEERHSEEEQDRAKSVQEKLAEAILKQSQCSSEPELSDTSTEEEEEHRDEGSEQASKEEDPKEEMVTEETKCDEGGSAEVSEEQKEIPKTEENEEEPHDDTKEEETCEAEEGEKGAEDEATAEKDEAEEQSEAQLPANENAAPDDKTTDSAEEDADVDAENDGERKEEVAVETDCHPDETEQRRESGEEDESSVSEQPEQADEAAVLDNAEAEAADATMEMKAESSEKQEALSCEEAPEAVTEGKADAEEGAGVMAESSSNQPQEDGDTTDHSTAEEGGGGEDEEHVSGAETGAEHSQQKNDELEEEKMVGEDEKKTEKLKPEKDVEEEGKQTDSEEVEEGVNTEEKDKSERKEVSNDESTVDQNTENSAEGSAKDTNAEAEVEVEGEETEEEEAATEEKEEEPEKTGTNEGNDIEKKETGESEKDGDESGGGEDRSSANLAAVKKDNGAENSEKDGGEENTEETEECEEERCETERREETSQVIEEPELREESKVDEELVQISTEIPADVPADEEETASINHAENVQKEDEKGEIEAKDEETEAPEAKENSSTSHERDMKTEGQEEEEGETEEPAEGEDPEEAPEKMEDEAVREKCTVVIETSENKGDDSLKVYDEFTKIDSEASGGEPKEHPDESKACEEGDQSDADHQNTSSDLTEKEKDIHDLTETQENLDAGDVGEAENWPDEEEQVLDDAAGDDAPADGADTEEVSKASEEGASVLLKPHSQHGEAGDTGRREAAEAPEVFAREDNTDLVTSWISVHQTSKFFQTFVEPLDDLTDAVVAPNSENKETASELQRSQSPGKLEAKSEDEEHKEMFRDEPEFLEDGSAKTTQVEEETEAKSSTSPTEPDDKQSPKEIKSEELQGRGASSEEEEAGSSERQHQEQIEVKSTSGSHHSASTSQPENQFFENATGPDAAAVQTTPEAPLEEEKNSQTEESWENAYSRQVTQITDFTTSVSVDGSREEPREEGEEIQRRGLEESFLIKDIQQTLHTEKLSPFSVDETLFAHTSYPLVTEL